MIVDKLLFRKPKSKRISEEKVGEVKTKHDGAADVHHHKHVKPKEKKANNSVGLLSFDLEEAEDE